MNAALRWMLAAFVMGPCRSSSAASPRRGVRLAHLLNRALDPAHRG